MTMQTQFLKTSIDSEESHLTNHICVKLITNASLRLIYSIYSEMHFVVNRHYNRCYHTLGVFSHLVPRADITAVRKCISQLSLVPVLDIKRISIKKLNFGEENTFFNKTAVSKDVLKMSKEAIEKVYILTIPA